jgi:hypothetical protein
MKILFLHGLESKPGGSKPKALAAAGHEVIEPQLSRDDWQGSVDAAKDAYEEHLPAAVVGSSRGGAVAMAAQLPLGKMVLIAPAWKKYCPTCPIPPGTTTLLSRRHDVITHDDSRLLSKMYGAKLISVGSDHRMNDSEALVAITSALDGNSK